MRPGRIERGFNSSTHIELAHEFLSHLTEQHDQEEPVSCEGQLWTPDARGLWVPRSPDQVAIDIGDMFVNERLCRRATDYRQITALALTLSDQPRFFEEAPLGVVCPDGFYRVEDGELKHSALAARDRQRFALDVVPTEGVDSPLLDAFLADAFSGDGRDEQFELLCELGGAALFGLLPKYAIATLLFGPAASGKSTWLQILQSVFPRGSVSAISPNLWDREYNVAALAGKRLNVVGELREDTPIPAAPFKNVLGGDLIQGRHPTHRPFDFVPIASHFFSANSLPVTLDRSEAFFRRWRVVRFGNSTPAHKRDVDLARRIIDNERGSVLVRLMDGARRVAKRRQLRTTQAHDEVLRLWRVNGNPALMFLQDTDYCQLLPGSKISRSKLYEGYERWTKDTGHGRLSSSRFYDLIKDTGSSIGVRLTRTADTRFAEGVTLVQ